MSYLEEIMFCLMHALFFLINNSLLNWLLTLDIAFCLSRLLPLLGTPVVKGPNIKQCIGIASGMTIVLCSIFSEQNNF